MFNLSRFPAVLLLVQAEPEHVTASEVLGNIPHDPASVFIYLLVVVSLGGIVLAGRSKKEADDGGA